MLSRLLGVDMKVYNRLKTDNFRNHFDAIKYRLSEGFDTNDTIERELEIIEKKYYTTLFIMFMICIFLILLSFILFALK